MNLPKKIKEVYEQAECIHNADAVENALDHMADSIHEKLAETNPLILCVMIGGMVPLGNLLPRLDFPLELDYLHATRYRGDVEGKDLHWKAKLDCDITDRTVLIVDDILDGGITLAAIVEHCRALKAKNVFTAVLVDKQHARLPEGLQQADFTGLSVDNRYVFGYGMDYHNYLRNAPGIFAVVEEND